MSKCITRNFYWMLLHVRNKKENITPKCIDKWKESFDINLTWKTVFRIPYDSCRCTKLQSFQYRLLHRTITCNHWLFNAKIRNNPNCDLCQVDDDIQHFFIRCDKVKNFWTALNRWWNRATPVDLNLSITEVDILFGILYKYKYSVNLNAILLLAKKYIHDCKITDRPIFFLSFLVLVRQYLSFEKEICTNKDCEKKFEDMWSWLDTKL